MLVILASWSTSANKKTHLDVSVSHIGMLLVKSCSRVNTSMNLLQNFRHLHPQNLTSNLKMNHCKRRFLTWKPWFQTFQQLVFGEAQYPPVVKQRGFSNNVEYLWTGSPQRHRQNTTHFVESNVVGRTSAYALSSRPFESALLMLRWSEWKFPESWVNTDQLGWKTGYLPRIHSGKLT